jgi:uncharacterized protein YndB with AHSA1/START domain
MSQDINTELDLITTRVIRAPRSAVWKAWSTASMFEKWWIPAPAVCKVVKMDLTPGGAFETHISENSGPFSPHLSACFLDIIEGERIVFTNALTGGWRPAEQPFMTAIITLADHDNGTFYSARAMHKNNADKLMHDELGFQDGWGTVTAQLAKLVEED